MKETLNNRQNGFPAAIGGGNMGAAAEGTLIHLYQSGVQWGGHCRINPDTAAHLPVLMRLWREGERERAYEKSLYAFASLPPDGGRQEALCDLELCAPRASFARTEKEEGTVLSFCRREGGGRESAEAFFPAKREFFVIKLCREGISSKEDDGFCARLTGTAQRDYLVRRIDETGVMLEYTAGSGCVCVMMGILSREGSGAGLVGDTCRAAGDGQFLLLVTAATSFETGDPQAACRNRFAALPAFDRIWAWEPERADGQTGVPDLPPQASAFVRRARQTAISHFRADTLGGNGIYPFTGGHPGRYDILFGVPLYCRSLFEMGLSFGYENAVKQLHRMSVSGTACAGRLYGCDGFVCHSRTDAFGDCAPMGRDFPGNASTLGGAALCLCLEEYMKEHGEILWRIYPILRQSARFFLSFYKKYGTYLPFPEGEPLSLWEGRMLSELFRAAKEAASAVGEDECVFEFDAFLQAFSEAYDMPSPDRLREAGDGELLRYLYTGRAALTSHEGELFRRRFCRSDCIGALSSEEKQIRYLLLADLGEYETLAEEAARETARCAEPTERFALAGALCRAYRVDMIKNNQEGITQ